MGVLVTDRTGNVILANPASKRIWGQVIDSGQKRWAQSKGFWHESGKRIDPDDWASTRALIVGQTSLNELIDIEAFDGRQKTIQNSAAPIRNAEGLIVGAVVVNEDVTERVHDQKALHESAQRLQHLSRRLLEVQEEERRHLARELHDEFGQILATITLHLHAAQGPGRARPPCPGWTNASRSCSKPGSKCAAWRWSCGRPCSTRSAWKRPCAGSPSSTSSGPAVRCSSWATCRGRRFLPNWPSPASAWRRKR